MNNSDSFLEGFSLTRRHMLGAMALVAASAALPVNVFAQAAAGGSATAQAIADHFSSVGTMQGEFVQFGHVRREAQQTCARCPQGCAGLAAQPCRFVRCGSETRARFIRIASRHRDESPQLVQRLQRRAGFLRETHALA